MTDFQKLFDAICKAGQAERSKFMLNIGDLMDACAANSSGKVIVDDKLGIGCENSYRGYYAELAFEPSDDPTRAVDVHAMCNRALTEAYEGYKGGTYRYSRDTPIWFAHYGCCGPAFIAITVRDGDIHLTTKEVD